MCVYVFVSVRVYSVSKCLCLNVHVSVCVLRCVHCVSVCCVLIRRLCVVKITSEHISVFLVFQALISCFSRVFFLMWSVTPPCVCVCVWM